MIIGPLPPLFCPHFGAHLGLNGHGWVPRASETHIGGGVNLIFWFPCVVLSCVDTEE